MAEETRGGNSRQLGKLIDQTAYPIAVVDRLGEIIFVNRRLCEVVAAEFSELVGLKCSWSVSEGEDRQFDSLRSALAPPASVLEGRIATRKLIAPVIYGTDFTGQLFVPIKGIQGVVDFVLVYLGDFEAIAAQVPAEYYGEFNRKRESERWLGAIRSQWKQLESLSALLGESPLIQLAMRRAQNAIANQAAFLMHGPEGSRLNDIAHGIFLGRLKQAGLQKVIGQFFPIECTLVDRGLLEGMLEVFQGRLRADVPIVAQHLHLEHIERLDSDCIELLVERINGFRVASTFSATSTVGMSELSDRGAEWQRLLALLAEIEIVVPPLVGRTADVPILLHQAVAVYCQRLDRALLSFAPDALDLLTAYPWPGNVDELFRAVEEAVGRAVLTTAIQVNHLPLALRTFPSIGHQSVTKVEPIDLDSVLLDIERVLIRRAIKLSPRNRAQVARLLGISRPRLLRRIEQLGLDEVITEAED